MALVKRITRSSSAQNGLSLIASGFIRMVSLTSRFRTIGREAADARIRAGEPFIAAFWHGRLLMAPTGWPRGVPLRVMISHHRDGEFITRTAARFGVNAVRGSSSKGGAAALRAMLKVLKQGDFVGITPDGPRGPRMRAQMGAIVLAQMAGVPIYPATYAVSRRRVAGSWDRFIVALPFSRGVYLWGEAVHVPRDADDDVLEAKRQELEDELNRLCVEADRMVGTEPVEPAPERPGRAAPAPSKKPAPAA